MKIPLEYSVSYTVDYGYLELVNVDEDTIKVIYHNKLLKNSPFTFSVTFSSEFKPHEIANDNDVRNWLFGITGELLSP